MWCRYLMWFAYEHIDFRDAEMQSILSMYNIPVKFIEEPTVNKPYWIIELPTEECAKTIASRSVLLKYCIELWSKAKSVSQLHANLNNSIANKSGRWIEKEHDDDDRHICPSALIEACCSSDRSFKVEVETFCKHFSMKEKIEKIESFNYLPLKGPVRLKNPDVTLAYLEFYGVDPNNVPQEPHDVFFGKLVADGQRDLIQVHSLKRRQFIGNTSMDAQLALLMANQARVRPADLVLDPFVGSGSLLVAAAHFGGYVWGSDIDYMMLHARSRPTRVGQKARTKEESIRGNMRQYGTEGRYLDVAVSDFSLPMWHERLRFDAIITDPPYGVREPTEKIGTERDSCPASPRHVPAPAPAHLSTHVPAKVQYALPHIYRDLLHFAAGALRLGGRLVCWYPLVRDEYRPEQVPAHPCLELVGNSEQVLSKLTARRLLTYERRRGDVPMPTRHLDPNGDKHNFREKYLAMGEISRRERKERKAEELAANAVYIARALSKQNDVT